MRQMRCWILRLKNPCLNVFKELMYSKNALIQHGYTILSGEPMKITISTKEFGYTGNEIANLLMECDIYPEFYDSDYIVLMPSPYNTKDDLKRLETCLCKLNGNLLYSIHFLN